MAETKYGKYIFPLVYLEGFGMDPETAGHDAPIAVNGNVFPYATHHIEIFTRTHDGTPHFHRPGTVREPVLAGSMAEKFSSGHLGGGAPGMYHVRDELFLFFGTNPDDPLDLGGEAELWLGEGDDAEKFVINKATGVFVPAGMIHNPLYFRKVDNPDKPIIMMVFADTPDYSVARITKVPSAFSMDG